MIRVCVALLMLASQLHADPPATRPTIEITRLPCTATRVMFDPKDPEPYIPRLNKGESAVTLSRFDCRADFRHELILTTERDGQIEVSIKLIGARVNLALQDVIYLPTDVRPPLRVHEEGHRVINERIYDQEAERFARDVAESLLAKTWIASGADREAAVQKAIESAHTEICTVYRERIARRVSQVSDKFDELTQHGSNDVRVVDAIERAFEACPPD